MLRSLFIRLSCLTTLALAAETATAQTKHVVQVGDNFFNPQNVTANVGDTIRWTFVPGSMENHTTTSGSIPAGAATWDQLVNTANPAFEYVITQAGTYNYVCTPHVSLGMVGSFTASPATSVTTVSRQERNLITPNPAKNSIVVAADLNRSNINILDMQGRIVKSWRNESGNTLDISDIPAGLYLVAIQKGKEIHKEKLVILE